MPHRSPSKRYGVLAVAAAAAISVAFVIAAWQTFSRRNDAAVHLREQRHADAVICQRVNQVYRIIQKQVTQSIKETPKIAYYKHHKKDLRLVLRSARAERTAFKPQRCPPAT